MTEVELEFYEKMDLSPEDREKLEFFKKELMERKRIKALHVSKNKNNYSKRAINYLMSRKKK